MQALTTAAPPRPRPPHSSYLVKSASGAFGFPLAGDLNDLDPLSSAKEILPPQVLSLAHSISKGLDGLLGAESPGVRPTFFCQVCLGNVDASDRYSLTGCRNEEHAFCRPCLSAWIGSRVEEGFTRIPCPLRASLGRAPSMDPEDDSGGRGETKSGWACEGIASTEDVVELCSPDAVARFRRFSLLKGPRGDEYRECPRCGRLNRGGVLRNAVAFVAEGFKPVVRCRHCAHRFCFYHGDAHDPSSSCLAYALRLRRRSESAEQESRELLVREARPCPKCQAPTHKAGGCNHMTCTHCERTGGERLHWCWICGEDLGFGKEGAARAAEHYAKAQGGGCPGGQFADPEAYATQLRFRCLSSALSGLATVGAVALWAWWTYRALWLLGAVALLAAVEWWRTEKAQAQAREAAPADPPEGPRPRGALLWLALVGAVLWFGLPVAALMAVYALISIAWAALVVSAALVLCPALAAAYWALRYCGRRDRRLERSVDFLLHLERSFRVLLAFPLMSTKWGAFVQDALRELVSQKTGKGL